MRFPLFVTILNSLLYIELPLPPFLRGPGPPGHRRPVGRGHQRGGGRHGQEGGGQGRHVQGGPGGRGAGREAGAGRQVTDRLPAKKSMKLARSIFDYFFFKKNRALAEAAFDRGSTDNVTVLLMRQPKSSPK